MAFVIVFSMSANVFAASAIIQESQTIRVNLEGIEVPSYDSMQLYVALKEIGFTDEEMFELYQREADRTGVDVRLPDALAIAMGKAYAYTTFPGRIMSYSEPQDGDEKFSTYKIDFGEFAKYCGWGGDVGNAIEFIVALGVNVFTKNAIRYLGLVGAGIILVTGILKDIFAELDAKYDGVTLVVKSVYHYDEYERLGKWYMVHVDYTFWK